MRRACVIGWPIKHSRSPLMHGYWLKQHAIDGAFGIEAVRPEHVAAFAAGLGPEGYSGCCVTMPNKEAAFAAAQVREPSAEAVGAANTLWVVNGRVHAANTDTEGFMTWLDVAAPGWQRPGQPVSVLGAGGAARAIVFGLLEAGVAEVRVFNRSRARADALAAQFGDRVHVHAWDDRSRLSRTASLLVNTTSVGLNGDGDLGMDFTGFEASTVVADIVYLPLETALLRTARAAGLITVDGLGMLLHQAVPQFERFFGVRPHVTKELRALMVADIEKAAH